MPRSSGGQANEGVPSDGLQRLTQTGVLAAHGLAGRSVGRRRRRSAAARPEGVEGTLEAVKCGNDRAMRCGGLRRHRVARDLADGAPVGCGQREGSLPRIAARARLGQAGQLWLPPRSQATHGSAHARAPLSREHGAVGAQRRADARTPPPPAQARGRARPEQAKVAAPRFVGTANSVTGRAPGSPRSPCQRSACRPPSLTTVAGGGDPSTRWATVLGSKAASWPGTMPASRRPPEGRRQRQWVVGGEARRCRAQAAPAANQRGPGRRSGRWWPCFVRVSSSLAPLRPRRKPRTATPATTATAAATGILALADSTGPVSTSSADSSFSSGSGAKSTSHSGSAPCSDSASRPSSSSGSGCSSSGSGSGCSTSGSGSGCRSGSGAGSCELRLGHELRLRGGCALPRELGALLRGASQRLLHLRHQLAGSAVAGVRILCEGPFKDGVHGRR